MTAPEIRWIENDMKVELFALDIKRLRESYLEKNPNASNRQVNDYINRKLRNTSDSLLAEQFKIISDIGLIKNRKV